jgi:DNA-binding response OmpR family regulator
MDQPGATTTATMGTERTHRRPLVLVVDDDAMVLDVVARYLVREGFEPHRAADGPSAVALAEDLRPDLVILDLMLPGFDGLEVFRRIRAARDVPVIMLTALGEEADRLAGLELGADDYVVKPFSSRELAVRARNLLRRSSAEPGPPADQPEGHERVLIADDLRVDTAARTVELAGAPAALTTLELDLLAFLMRNPGTAFTREELLEHVWGYTVGDTATVTVHIRRLREKIEADPTAPVRIATVWGYGYRFDR